MTTESPLDAIRSTLASDRESVRVAVERIPAGMRGQRPSPDRWSAAEVLEHLAIVEQRSTAALAPRVAEAPPLGGSASVAGMSELRQFVVDRSRAIVAPDVITPTGQVDAEAAWTALQ